MSIFHTAMLRCPKCGEDVEISWAASVNAGRRPDLRAAILDRSFQAEDCPACGTTIRSPPHLTYVDMARGDWILVEDAAELPRWPEHDAEATKLFEDTFGASAAPSTRDLATDIRPRLVFGWPALREKIICTELGLDDVSLELLKMAVIRNVAAMPSGEGLALRLVGGTAETLTLAVTDDQSEERVASADVPRSLYDDISGDIATWAPLRDRLVNQTLVDLTRFTVGG